MTEAETVRRLEKFRQEEARVLICEVFKTDPANFYATTNPVQQAHLLNWFASLGLALGFRHGEVYTTDRLSGVAVWLRPGSDHLSLGTMLRTGCFPPLRAGLTTLWRFFRVMDFADRVHRGQLPGKHWYLFILTVAPASQGRGLGSRLLQPILDQADAAKLPCYLETTNPRAVPFYEKHGFHIAYQGRLPGSEISFWGVQRDPR